MSRNIKDLHPRLQDKIGELKFKCEQQGLSIGIGECLRTLDEQDALYAQGRTKSGKIVTNAKGINYSSQHQWGIAVDFYRNDGIGAFENGDKFFEKVGKIAKSIDLGWGGDWTSIKDRPHLYIQDWGSTTSKLKARYGTPDKFMATWNTNTSSSTTTSPVLNLDKKTIVSCGQVHINNFTGAGIEVDSIRGSNTKKAGVMALQIGLNKDYLADLKVDGICGERTKTELSGKYVRNGDNGYMVTALEILLMLKGYNPRGVECPGVFGRNLDDTVRQYQEDNGLVVDGIAGSKTFISLIS